MVLVVVDMANGVPVHLYIIFFFVGFYIAVPFPPRCPASLARSNLFLIFTFKNSERSMRNEIQFSFWWKFSTIVYYANCTSAKTSVRTHRVNLLRHSIPFVATEMDIWQWKLLLFVYSSRGKWSHLQFNSYFFFWFLIHSTRSPKRPKFHYFFLNWMPSFTKSFIVL